MNRSPDRGEIDSRLRLELIEMRGAPDTGLLVETTLRSIPGVLDVRVDARTGSVEILYEPDAAEASTRPAPPAAVPALVARPRAPASTLPRIVETAVVVLLEVALQRMLGSFFSPRRS